MECTSIYGGLQWIERGARQRAARKPRANWRRGNFLLGEKQSSLGASSRQPLNSTFLRPRMVRFYGVSVSLAEGQVRGHMKKLLLPGLAFILLAGNAMASSLFPV